MRRWRWDKKLREKNRSRISDFINQAHTRHRLIVSKRKQNLIFWPFSNHYTRRNKRIKYYKKNPTIFWSISNQLSDDNKVVKIWSQNTDDFCNQFGSLVISDHLLSTFLNHHEMVNLWLEIFLTNLCGQNFG